MLFWVESRACKAPKTWVASIWRPLGAFYNEICLTNVLQNGITDNFSEHHVVLGGVQGL